MLFNSLPFLIFAAIFFLLWPCFRKSLHARWGFLSLASLLFYAWWDWRFIFLLIGSGLVAFYIGRAMAKMPGRRKSLLLLALILHLGLLLLFKYADFFTENVRVFLSALGVSWQPNRLALPLPLGISFITFECLSYVIDIYRGKLVPTSRFLHFFSFLSLFPHLIAGPIIRPADLLPQLEKTGLATEEQKWRGLRLMILGFFKKMVLADNLAPLVNAAFQGDTPDGGMLFWWLVTTSFAFQIYFDFSGYTDIARGLANWMGFEFPLNFDQPYRAKTFRDFWGRWHISLSTWFRDYVYIPLGGSKRGTVAGIFALWITFLLSGAWHGAGWTFILWGALHAFYLTVERATSWQKHLLKIPAGGFLVTLLMIVQIWVAWVIFRAENLDQAGHIIARLFDFRSPFTRITEAPNFRAITIIFSIVFWEVARALHRRKWINWGRRRREQIEFALLAVMVVAAIYLRGAGGAFIYFQF